MSKITSAEYQAGYAAGYRDGRKECKEEMASRIEELEKALEPFADMLPAFLDFLPPGAEDCAYEINGADFRLIDIRTAARALKGEATEAQDAGRQTPRS
jgi:hypothetical protein